MLRRAVPLLAAGTLLLAACAGGPSPRSTASRAAAPSAGVVATPSATPAPVKSPPSNQADAPTGDWTTYHRDNARTGNARTGNDSTAVRPDRLTVAWSAKLDGAVYGQPLVVGEAILAATESDTIYALDAASGRVRWQQHVGEPVRRSTLPCGDIDPLGITGTMVYDPASQLVFAVAEVAGPHHDLVGIDVTTGQVRVRRGIDPPTDNPKVLQQRAALALSSGRVYVAYGGLYGDCGDYHGWVLASAADGHGPVLSYRVPTTREGGIWAPSGPAVDTAGNLYVAVGNGESTKTYDGSESVVKLSADLAKLDLFAPASWAQENATDTDLGSTGPALLPDGLVFIAGKSGTGYVLRADRLGGIGGAAASAPVCTSFGGTALLDRTLFVPCRDGVRSVTIGPDGGIAVGWHAAASVDGSPVVGAGVVWAIDTRGGVLHALDPATGRSIATQQVGAVPHFASPTLTAGQVLIGTMDGVVAIGAG